MNNEFDAVVGCNVPEFFEALNGAAGNARGYFWCPIIIWRDRNNKTSLTTTKKEGGKPKWEGKWEKIMTVTPHVYET